MFIRADRAEARFNTRFLRLLGWLSLIGAVSWLVVNLTNARATLTSWTLEQTAWPALLIGGAALILRGSADQRLEFDRATRTVRRSSQFRTRVEDLSGLEVLFLQQPALRGWIGRYWRSEVTLFTYKDDFALDPDQILLLIAVTEIFNDELLDWWLNQP